MKIAIDVDRLLADGKISDETYLLLKNEASIETGNLAYNILVALGIFGVACGLLALMPTTTIAMILGIALFAAGISLTLNFNDQWGLLGSTLSIIGSITAAGGCIEFFNGKMVGFLIVAAIYLLTSILTKSSILSILSALSFSAAAGAMTYYGHASYYLVIHQPAVTVVLFSAFALITYHISKRTSPEYERLAIAFSRTSLFLVNFGFWVGSLWGDSLWYKRNHWNFGSGDIIPDWAFSIAWAVALFVTGIWATHANRRWVVNLLATFGSIHFYTQFFEYFGAQPLSILFAGIILIAIAFAIIYYNKSNKTKVS